MLGNQTRKGHYIVKTKQLERNRKILIIISKKIIIWPEKIESYKKYNSLHIGIWKDCKSQQNRILKSQLFNFKEERVGCAMHPPQWSRKLPFRHLMFGLSNARHQVGNDINSRCNQTNRNCLNENGRGPFWNTLRIKKITSIKDFGDCHRSKWTFKWAW